MMPTVKPHEKTTSYSLLLASWVVIVWGIIEAKKFLVTMMGAILFAFLLMPLMNFLKRRNLPEWLCLLLVSLVLIIPILLLGSLVFSEIHSVAKEWHHLQSSFNEKFEAWLIDSGIQSSLSNAGISSPLEKIGTYASQAAHWMLESVRAIFSLGTEFSLMAIFAVVGIGSRVHLRKSFEKVFLAQGKPERVAVIDRSIEVLEKFLMARFSIIIFVSIVDFVILKLFGLNYAIISSIALGLSTLIPAIGFFMGAVPAVSIALAEGKSLTEIGLLFLAVWIVASFQDHFLAPKLLGKHLNLNFLVTYLAIFVGERIWGVPGMFLSVPILAVIQVWLASSEKYQSWTLLFQGHERSDDQIEEKSE